jgi:hypothetical protein
MDKSNAMDWVFILAVVQLLGLKYLMTATDGWLLFARVTPRKRKAALAIGMGIIWIPFLLVWATYGHSPVDMWNAATAWWQADVGLVGMAIAIAGWWSLLSPFQALLAIYTIQHETVRELRQSLATAELSLM